MAGHIHDWSTTAASNNTADSTVNWSEGQLPGTVNDSARAMMAAQASWIKDNGGTVTTSGSDPTYTATLNEAITSYSTGMTAVLNANFTNTGSATLNVNSIGAKAIKMVGASGEGNPQAGAIRSGGIYDFIYNAAANSGSGAWILTNSRPAVVTQVITSSGTYTPTAGMSFCIIECVGGGGGGGGTVDSSANTGSSGGGGGAGSYSRKLSTAAAIGASQTATIGAAGAAGTAGNNAGGAGGDTSIGSICIGKGGSGGAGHSGTAGSATAGAGGVAGTGDVAATGQPGNAGQLTLSVGGLSAAGGSSSFGGGGAGKTIGTGTTTGNAGTGYGAGGAGGASYNAGGTAAGGAGTAGLIIITEYL